MSAKFPKEAPDFEAYAGRWIEARFRGALPAAVAIFRENLQKVIECGALDRGDSFAHIAENALDDAYWIPFWVGLYVRKGAALPLPEAHKSPLLKIADEGSALARFMASRFGIDAQIGESVPIDLLRDAIEYAEAYAQEKINWALSMGNGNTAEEWGDQFEQAWGVLFAIRDPFAMARPGQANGDKRRAIFQSFRRIHGLGNFVI